jgi:uncharacterized protein YgiM (DUF1202 family)
MMDGLASPHCAKGTASARDRLNVRAEPTAASKVLGVLVAGELVVVWAVLNGWAIVQNVAGLTGWASMTYLKPEGELTP